MEVEEEQEVEERRGREGRENEQGWEREIGAGDAEDEGSGEGIWMESERVDEESGVEGENDLEEEWNSGD